jgi:hypothetical protein
LRPPAPHTGRGRGRRACRPGLAGHSESLDAGRGRLPQPLSPEPPDLVRPSPRGGRLGGGGVRSGGPPWPEPGGSNRRRLHAAAGAGGRGLAGGLAHVELPHRVLRRPAPPRPAQSRRAAPRRAAPAAGVNSRPAQHAHGPQNGERSAAASLSRRLPWMSPCSLAREIGTPASTLGRPSQPAPSAGRGPPVGAPPGVPARASRRPSKLTPAFPRRLSYPAGPCCAPCGPALCA